MGSASRPTDDVVADGEEGGAREREGGAEQPEMLRALPLAGECDTTGDDKRGAEDEEWAQRLVQHCERDPHRHQRRDPDQDRRARGAGVADGDDEQHLRRSRREQACEGERPEVGDPDRVVDERRDREGDRQQDGDSRHDDRAELRVRAAPEAPPDGDRERAEDCARERGEEDRDQLLGSAHARPVDAHRGDHRRSRGRRARVRRALVGGCALGLATGWNISNTGAIATQLSRSYGVGLATIGLFTTALFTTHLLAQIPGGRASDHFGARRAGLLALVVIAVFSAVSMAAPAVWLAIVTRALAGIGTGVSFIAGSAYVRAVGGSPAAQGVFGGVGLAGGGFALAVVPQVEGYLGWRAPYATAVAVALLGLALLAAAPADARRPRPAREGALQTGVVRDRRLYRLALLYSASLGLSVTLGNWVVTLLDRHGGLGKGSAGAIGSLTLVLGILTRPLGGWILREHPRRTRLAVGASLAGGAGGTLLLALAQPPEVAALGAALVGIAAGIPFAPSFTGAALLRPDSPAAAVGLVNGAAAAVILAGTPLLGLSFGLPGDGRVGFCVVAGLWLVALLGLPAARQLGATAAQRSR